MENTKQDRDKIADLDVVQHYGKQLLDRTTRMTNIIKKLRENLPEGTDVAKIDQTLDYIADEVIAMRVTVGMILNFVKVTQDELSRLKPSPPENEVDAEERFATIQNIEELLSRK